MCRKFRKGGLFAAILPVVCLFTSCDEPSYTITEITNFRPIANGLQIKVSPTNVKAKFSFRHMPEVEKVFSS